MITASIDQIELQRAWSDTRPEVAFAFGLAVSTFDGSSSSQVVCVALEPGKSGGRHAHSAEEILIVLQGTAELTVGDERERLSSGGIAVIPAETIHEPVNVGRETLRFLAIFPAAAVLHSWEVPIEPLGTATFLTPPTRREFSFNT